jgi:hypothetical protein
LSGYTILLYGEPKVGKTTFARDAGALILETERGCQALSGAYVADITKWADLKAAIRELKKPEVKERFKIVAIDTVDVLCGYCEKYVCASNDISSLGELGYGKGWTIYKKEIEDSMREITNLGYSLLFISHSKEREIKEKNGNTYMKMGTTLTESISKVIKGMADIICYAHVDSETGERMLDLRSSDGCVDVGARFAYIQPKVQFKYNALEKAIVDAIEKEEEVSGLVTEKAETNENSVNDAIESYDELNAEFDAVVTKLLEKDENNNILIQKVISKVLGVGHKFYDCTPNQVEAMSIVVNELRSLV